MMTRRRRRRKVCENAQPNGLQQHDDNDDDDDDDDRTVSPRCCPKSSFPCSRKRRRSASSAACARWTWACSGSAPSAYDTLIDVYPQMACALPFSLILKLTGAHHPNTQVRGHGGGRAARAGILGGAAGDDAGGAHGLPALHLGALPHAGLGCVRACVPLFGPLSFSHSLLRAPAPDRHHPPHHYHPHQQQHQQPQPRTSP